jgi:hypothetical protein
MTMKVEIDAPVFKSQHNKIPVMCVETGMVFDSITSAANWLIDPDSDKVPPEIHIHWVRKAGFGSFPFPIFDESSNLAEAQRWVRGCLSGKYTSVGGLSWKKAQFVSSKY